MAKKISKSNPTIVVDKSGKILGEFPNQYDAENYVSSVGRQPVFFEDLEPLEVYGQAPKKKRNFLEMGAANLEETFGLTPRDAVGFVPIVGDALDIYDVGNNFYNKNYTAAGIGLASLLLPDFIVKGGKKIYRNIRNTLNGNNIYRAENLLKKTSQQRHNLQNKINNLYDDESNLHNALLNYQNKEYYAKKNYDLAKEELKNFSIRHNALRKTKGQYNISVGSNPRTFSIGEYTDEFGNSIPISINSDVENVLNINSDNYIAYPYRYTSIPKLFTKSNQLMSLTGEREKRLKTLIGNSGILGGSSKLASSGYITHIPGDDDILTTASRYNDLLSRIDGREIRSLRNNVGYKVKSNRLRGGESDIDIIEQDRDGYAKGVLAHELYAIQHPKEYRALREKHAKKEAFEDNVLYGGVDFADVSLPIKTEDLYQSLTDDVIVQKSLSDLLFSHNPKHAQRRLQLFANKDAYPAIEKSLNDKFQILYGKDLNLPKSFKLDNIEANKKLLKEYNLPTELAEDSKAMELLSKYLYLSEGSATRRTNVRELQNSDTYEDFLKSLDESSNATYSYLNKEGSGRGGNFTTTDSGGGKVYGQYSSIVTDEIPNNITNPEELLNYLKGDVKITPEIRKRLSIAFGQDFSNYNTMRSLHYDTGIIPNTAESNADLANIFGKKFSRGSNYNDGSYIGRLAPAENIGTMFSPTYLTFEHGVLSPRSLEEGGIDTKTINSLELFEKLKQTEKGNLFQQAYMKNVKEAKAKKVELTKQKNEAKTKYNNISSETNRIEEEMNDLRNQMQETINNEKNLYKREQKLNKLRYEYKRKQEKYNKILNISKKSGIGIGTIGLGTATYKILNNDEKDKKYYGGHISLETAY